MKAQTWLIFVLCLCAYAPAWAVPGDVLSSLPAPCRTPTGLAFDGRLLWVADRLTDSLYAVNPADGRVVRTLAAPGFDVRGLAWDGAFLWCVDAEENRISKLDVNTGVTLLAFDSPTPTPEGLAWDGKNLWLVDGAKQTICQISTDDGTTIVSHPTPSIGSTALAWWKDYLWVADRRDDKLYLFDPKHGEVVFGMDAPGKHARGLATDGDVLWNVDYQDDVIYRLSLDDTEPVRRSDADSLHLLLTYEFRNYGPGDVPSLDVYVALPHDMPNQTLLGPVQFIPRPSDTVTDRWQQPLAHFHFENVPHEQRTQVRMEASAVLYKARWLIYPHRVGSLKEIPKEVREAYLVDEDKYRITDPVIQQAVKEAVGDETNPYWMMRRIHKYVREHLTYELAGGWNVAPQVLTRGNGSCSEYTFLFISLCRAAGIPARYVGSVVVRNDDASFDNTFHRWSQVYLPNYGWVHVDPQGGDRDKLSEIAASIGQVDNRFLITTEGGGASEYLGWGYNYDHRWTARGPVKIYSDAVGEWSPLRAGLTPPH
ncbi:MAG: transglutaminase [bacterium]|nr:transglutaminase [bacterium]